jgi:hypothetical protein
VPAATEGDKHPVARVLREELVSVRTRQAGDAGEDRRADHPSSLAQDHEVGGHWLQLFICRQGRAFDVGPPPSRRSLRRSRVRRAGSEWRAWRAFTDRYVRSCAAPHAAVSDAPAFTLPTKRSASTKSRGAGRRVPPPTRTYVCCAPEVSMSPGVFTRPALRRPASGPPGGQGVGRKKHCCVQCETLCSTYGATGDAG